jgi:hypothetical protein
VLSGCSIGDFTQQARADPLALESREDKQLLELHVRVMHRRTKDTSHLAINDDDLMCRGRERITNDFSLERLDPRAKSLLHILSHRGFSDVVNEVCIS